MKYLLFLFIIYSFSFNTEKVDLRITVTNINTLKGSIELGIYNDAKSFLVKDKEYRTYSKSVTNDTIIFVLKDLVKGDYAISIYHDINSDKECNSNFIRMPIEPYGFSKNYKPRFSKPSFNDCKIEVNSNMSIMIKLVD